MNAAGVAVRPLGVRIKSPCCIRKGSYTSSTVSSGSLTLIARVFRPTGPPLNLVHSEFKIARVALSRPRVSTPKKARPSLAMSWLMLPIQSGH